MSSLLCVPPIVEITRIPKLVVDFTSVPLTERRIGAFVPMGFIGTTRRSKSFERAQMHETSRDSEVADRRQHFLLLSQIFHFLYILLLQKFFPIYFHP